MEMADAIAKRSSCQRRQCGAVIVTDSNRIVATGYNGPPAGLRFKYEGSMGTYEATCAIDCPRNNLSTEPADHLLDYDNCISIHAEGNALLFCDRRDRDGGTIYITSSPCYGCSKQIANSGLKRVVFRLYEADAYRDPERSINTLRDSGLTVDVKKA